MYLSLGYPTWIFMYYDYFFNNYYIILWPYKCTQMCFCCAYDAHKIEIKQERKRKESRPPSISVTHSEEPCGWMTSQAWNGWLPPEIRARASYQLIHAHTHTTVTEQRGPMTRLLSLLSLSFSPALSSLWSIHPRFILSVLQPTQGHRRERERLKTREMPVGSICSVVRYTQAMGRPPLTRSNCQTHTFRLFAALEASSSQHPISFLPCLISSAPSLKFLRPSALCLCGSVCAACFCCLQLVLLLFYVPDVMGYMQYTWVFVLIRKRSIHKTCGGKNIQDSWISLAVKKKKKKLHLL